MLQGAKRWLGEATGGVGPLYSQARDKTVRYARLADPRKDQETILSDVGVSRDALPADEELLLKYRDQPRWIQAAIPAGAIIGNSVLDNPVGGLVDTATFNALNLRDDEWERDPINTYPANTVPVLDEEQVRRQRDYMQKRIATDMITLNQLNRMAAQNMMRPDNVAQNVYPEVY